MDGYEQGLGRAEYGCLPCALRRMNPRARYTTAWKVFDIWGTLQPPQQAAAAPPELISAMMVVFVALGKVDLGLIVCLCFSGLLRVGESLRLRWKDVFFSSGVLTLCLAQTKRGMEQKVVITNPMVLTWVVQYYKFSQQLNWGENLFHRSYSSVLRWVKKVAALLGAGHVQLTTHSFRRSGASELARRGVPIADIMMFGRWLSDRSAREYIRKGEVAVLRAQEKTSIETQTKWGRWCSLTPCIWHLQAALQGAEISLGSQKGVTQASFTLLESWVFRAFKV